MAAKKPKPKKEVHTCDWKGCKVKLDSGHQKWCTEHKKEVRRKQNQKSAQRYASKWGNQRLTTKQTAMIKLKGVKTSTRPTAKQSKVHSTPMGTVKKSVTQKSESRVIVGGHPVEVIT